MNKLEEYRDTMTITYTVPKDVRTYDYCEGYEAGHKMGFDAAIALDLPVRFLNWSLEGECRFDVTDEDQWWDNEEKKNMTTKEVFEYWINNIYKP